MHNVSDRHKLVLPGFTFAVELCSCRVHQKGAMSAAVPFTCIRCLHACAVSELCLSMFQHAAMQVEPAAIPQCVWLLDMLSGPL